MNRFLLTTLAFLALATAQATTYINGPAYFGDPELPMTQPLYSNSGGVQTTATRAGPLIGSLNNINTAFDALMPFNGSVSLLRFDVTTAPGTGNSWVATLQKYGPSTGNVWTDTALTCTISDSATAADDLVNVVSYVRGDNLRWRIVPTGTPATTFHTVSAKSVSSAAKDSLVVFGTTTATVSKTVPVSVALNATDTAGGLTVMPTSGTLDRLYCSLRSGSGGGTYQVSLRVNGVDQALSTTLTSPTFVGSDDVNSIHVNAGDIVQIYGNPTTALADNKYFSGSMRFRPDINGESFIVRTRTTPTTFGTTYHPINTNRQSTDNITSASDNRLRSGRTPVALTLRKLYAYAETTPATGSWNIRTVKNGSAGTLVANIATGTQTAFDTSNSDSVAVGDLLLFNMQGSSSPTASNVSASVVTYIDPQAP